MADFPFPEWDGEYQEFLEAAREQGRQEIRDAIIAQMDVYAPHAVAWWNDFNAILKFDPRGR